MEFPAVSLTTEENSTIRMKSETVNIFIDVQKRIEATFIMENPTPNPITITVGFPAPNKKDLPFYNLENKNLFQFKVIVNGNNIDHIYQKEIKNNSLYNKLYNKCTWSYWECAFPPGDTKVEVLYNIETNNSYRRSTQNVYYIFSTGSKWRDTIGNAQLTIHFPYEINPEQIMAPTKPKVYIVDGNKIKWHFVDFEPDQEDDLHFEYLPLSLYKEVLELREKIKQNPRRAKPRIDLSHFYFSHIMTSGLALFDLLDTAEFKEILNKTTNQQDYDFLLSVYQKNPYHPETSVVFPSEIKKETVNRVFKILCSIGYEPVNRFYRRQADEVENLLNEAVSLEPKNSSAWNTYLAYFGHLHFCGMSSEQIFPAEWVPEKNKYLIQKAWQNCPNDKAIRYWQEVINDNLKPIPKKIIYDNEVLETRANILMKYYKKKLNRRSPHPNYKYKLKLKKGKLLPSERLEILRALFNIDYYESDYYPDLFRDHYKKMGII